MAIASAPAETDYQIIAQGHGFEFVGTLTFSGSYSTGGEVPSPTLASYMALQGNGVVDKVDIEPRGGYQFAYDHATGKITVRYSDYDAGADGPLIEIPAASYPAAITATPLKVVVRGR